MRAYPPYPDQPTAQNQSQEMPPQGMPTQIGSNPNPPYPSPPPVKQKRKGPPLQSMPPQGMPFQGMPPQGGPNAPYPAQPPLQQAQQGPPPGFAPPQGMPSNIPPLGMPQGGPNAPYPGQPPVQQNRQGPPPPPPSFAPPGMPPQGMPSNMPPQGMLQGGPNAPYPGQPPVQQQQNRQGPPPPPPGFAPPGMPPQGMPLNMPPQGMPQGGPNAPYPGQPPVQQNRQAPPPPQGMPPQGMPPQGQPGQPYSRPGQPAAKKNKKLFWILVSSAAVLVLAAAAVLYFFVLSKPDYTVLSNTITDEYGVFLDNSLSDKGLPTEYIQAVKAAGFESLKENLEAGFDKNLRAQMLNLKVRVPILNAQKVQNVPDIETLPTDSFLDQTSRAVRQELVSQLSGELEYKTISLDAEVIHTPGASPEYEISFRTSPEAGGLSEIVANYEKAFGETWSLSAADPLEALTSNFSFSDAYDVLENACLSYGDNADYLYELAQEFLIPNIMDVSYLNTQRTQIKVDFSLGNVDDFLTRFFDMYFIELAEPVYFSPDLPEVRESIVSDACNLLYDLVSPKSDSFIVDLLQPSLEFDVADLESDLANLYDGLCDVADKIQETIDYNAIYPLQLPPTSVLQDAPTGDDAIEYTITGQNGKPHYVIFKSLDGGRDITAFIRAEDTLTVSVPPGTYEFYVSNGDYWYGETHRFGNNGSYKKFDEIFEDPPGSSFTLTLSIPGGGGNAGSNAVDYGNFG